MHLCVLVCVFVCACACACACVCLGSRCSVRLLCSPVAVVAEFVVAGEGD